MSKEQRKISRRGLMKAAVRLGIGAAGAGLPSLGWAHAAEPEWVEVSQVRLTLPRLDPAFRGLRLVQLSDIHFDGNYMSRARLEHIVALVNAQQPDVVAITGDFVTATPELFSRDLTAGLSGLRARDAVVAVLGNHDHWSDPEVVRAMLRASGITELRNDVQTLRRGAAALHLAGLDDAWVGQARLERLLPRLAEPGAAVLLAHEPDFADDYARTARFDLQLSGHSHGGQVSLPVAGPPALPRYGRKYYRGRYQVGTMTVYTNRGIGMLEPYVRLNCRPEITVFTLLDVT